MQKITPFLWFNSNAEEAMQFYISVFKNGKITSPGTFEINGQEFMVLSGGTMFKFNEAISLFVNCETQEEVDNLWEKLSQGGEKSRCGWVKDKYGLSWQIIPATLGKFLSDPDTEKAKRVLQAMLQMTKIEIAGLERAYEGR